MVGFQLIPSHCEMQIEVHSTWISIEWEGPWMKWNVPTFGTLDNIHSFNHSLNIEQKRHYGNISNDCDQSKKSRKCDTLSLIRFSNRKFMSPFYKYECQVSHKTCSHHFVKLICICFSYGIVYGAAFNWYKFVSAWLKYPLNHL